MCLWLTHRQVGNDSVYEVLTKWVRMPMKKNDHVTSRMLWQTLMQILLSTTAPARWLEETWWSSRTCLPTAPLTDAEGDDDEDAGLLKGGQPVFCTDQNAILQTGAKYEKHWTVDTLSCVGNNQCLVKCHPNEKNVCQLITTTTTTRITE